ncbi:hypothetical protein BH09MYX1_BH09MYX1_52970 [soil metagenome]
MTARLHTIGISHYCEKARWALDRAGVDYVEDAHAPLFHMLHGGRKTRPILVGGALTLRDSTEILQHLDRDLPEPKKLYPSSIGAAALALEEEYDKTLGVDVRRVAYGAIGLSPRLFARLGGVLAPPFEDRVIRTMPRLILVPLVRAFKVQGGPPPRALARVEATFAAASAILEQKPFLAGDRFSAADLTFASLAAPVILPEGHPAMPSVEETAGEPIFDLATRLRSTKAGAHVVKMYRDERKRA